MPQFPASKYVRYKRATSFFLDWLLRVRGGGRDASKCIRLETLTQVVEELAAELSTLTPTLLKDFPKALAACHCAITLREHVAAFFADDEHGHQHFLGLLRSWLDTLKGVVVKPRQQQQDDGTADEQDGAKYKNYYEALEVDADYFPDEETYVAEPSASKAFKVDRQQLLEEAFAEDMRLEVAYLFIELEELAHEVFNAYDSVKKQQCTMVEATLVAKLAMDLASSLIATLQLQYPSLQSGLDFLEVVMEKDPDGLSSRMGEAYRTTRSNLENDGVFKFVPGMFLLDFDGVGTTLETFARIIPPNLQYTIVAPRGFYGESYDEGRTPHYVLPDLSNMNMVTFLRQQLPELYNSISYTKVTTFKTYEPTEDPDWRLSGPFISVMDKFFKSREVTASAVFVCICWQKSVAALQGDGGLKKYTSWTLKHSADITTKFDVAVAKGTIEAVDKELHDFFTFYSVFMRVSNSHSHLAHTNPILAGLMMLDHHFEYLDLASELVVVTPKFYAFAHLYNALVTEGFLPPLPFLEDILGVYEKMLFTPSRAAAGHGSYYRTYLLSLSLKATALEEVICGKRGNIGGDMRKARSVFLLSDVSKIFRLMVKGDNSVLGGLSSTGLLTSAAKTCSKESFESRVLSRDIVALHDDLSDVFSMMCDVLGKGTTRGESETFVVTSVIRALDALQPNGELLVSALPGGNPYPWLNRVSGWRVKEVCKKLAAVVEAKFGASAEELEQRYCVFSSLLDEEKSATGDHRPKSHPTVIGLAEQLQRIAVGTPSSNTPEAAAKKMKKKKCKKRNKKNKKDNVKRDQSSSAPRAAAGGVGEVAEVSIILKQLLVAVGVDTAANQDQPGVSTMEELSRQTVAAVFTRLRDPDIPVQFKAVNVQHATVLMERLQGLAAEFSTPAKETSSSTRMRNLIFSEASRVIYLMQRFHRTDHPAIKVPPLAPVRDFCDTSESFTLFLAATAQIGVSIGKKPQAQDILDLLEKRLLALRCLPKVMLVDFRLLVKIYSTAREGIGFGTTSNAETFCALEWYLTDTVENSALLLALDGLAAKPFYFDLVTAGSQDTIALERAMAAVPRVVCYMYGDRIKHIAYGGSREGVSMTRKKVVALAESVGVQLCERNSQNCVTSLRVGDFVFSADGVVRDTASK